MNNDLTFRIILGTLFVLVVGTRRYYEQKAVITALDGLDQDRDSRIRIALQSLLLTVSNLAMIAYIINPSWMTWSSLYLLGWLRWIGAALGVTATGALIWTHRALGNNFFGGMKIRRGHQLIKSGPYRWVRHPMYTTFILLGLAWFLLSENWMIAGFWLAATVLVIVTRLSEEERMMLQQFGEDYRTYAEQTGRFLPRLRTVAPSTDTSA